MGRVRTNVAFAAGAVAAVVLSVAVLYAYLSAVPPGPVLRLGYFPNLTHAQALYGISTGFYQRALGGGTTLIPIAFNAGPTAVQALLSNQIDMTFVGPSPTLNGLAVAGPDVLRVIAGGSSGGALFVLQSYVNITTSADFSGKKFATPQAGNTQDIALKHYLLTQGHKTVDQGGDVDVINAPNADILSLFQLHQIDGAWVPEPWGTRLILEGNGKPFQDLESSLWPNGRFVTTHLLTTKRYLDERGSVVRAFLDAQVTLTLILENATDSAKRTVNDAITNVTGSALPFATLNAAFANVNATYDPVESSLATYLTWAQDLGYIPSGVTTGGLYDLTILNDVLAARGLPPVT